MKKWLDKTWAKVVAFCLLLVFTVLAAAGGGAIAWLISDDAYVDGGNAWVGDYGINIIRYKDNERRQTIYPAMAERHADVAPPHRMLQVV